ncbi:MAG: hypothetical protein AB1782_01525 [Cyanobacteriota bacterium]
MTSIKNIADLLIEPYEKLAEQAYRKAYYKKYGKYPASHGYGDLDNESINAFQHAYMSALITYEKDKNTAYKLGRLKENLTTFFLDDYDFQDHNRDFYNNEVGSSLGFGEKLRLISNKDNLGIAILDALDSGLLITKIPDSKNRYSKQTWDLMINVYNDPQKIQLANDIIADTQDLYDKGIVSYSLLLGIKGELQIWGEKGNKKIEDFKSFLNDNYNNVIDQIKDLFNQAKQTISPLILDLDGDGVETLSINNGTYFDHNADGFSELTGWAGKDDGLLVLDINDNGLIDSGRELFGEHTLLSNGEEASGGFEALAELDSNLDGKIDANDTQFSDLKIWIDANSDGITDSGELHTLGELNIESISLNFENVNKEDAEGNLISQAGSYTTTDQVTHDLSDIKFQVNNVFSQAVETLEISPEVEALTKIKVA